ncbi:DUF4920 domain-containing protein [Marinicella meishanensis]|uniref:DUF4920 domain-containing protein n=1 Tax=Marinicella meishanensis TaxID=2873263 RepID=UPI001CBAD68B|nr:DUF4920 domain-containing protein [Marinicella sp. NBU2979]
MINKTAFTLILLVFNFMAIADSMQGKPAPSFNLQDQSGQVHQLADYQGKWLVVYFYPKNDTTGCTIEAKAFRDNYQTIRHLDAEVLGVSLDDAESHRAFIAKYDLPFNLLVDANKQMSRDYGVDGGLAVFSYAKRQTFIIDPSGQVAVHFEQVDPNTHAEEVIAALQKLQQNNEHAPAVHVTEVIDGDAVYGQSWPTADVPSQGIAAALQQADVFLEGQHVITGRVTQVCQKKGCWMILAEGDAFARVDFNDHAFLIPKDTLGEAAVYGRLVKKQLSEEQRAHYAEEGAGELPADSYELVADAVRIFGS